MIFTAVVTVLSDQSFYGFINAALCVKQSHQSYQLCHKVLSNRTNWQSESAKMHFESGSRNAIGAFNLVCLIVRMLSS